MFTNILFVAQPLFTAVICLGKGIAAGWAAGATYRLMSGVNKFLASVMAAAVAPVVNTGLFILGGLTLVKDTLEANLGAFGADSVLIFLVIGCAGVIFLVEFGVNKSVIVPVRRDQILASAEPDLSQKNVDENAVEPKDDLVGDDLAEDGLDDYDKYLIEKGEKKSFFKKKK